VDIKNTEYVVVHDADRTIEFLRNKEDLQKWVDKHGVTWTHIYKLTSAFEELEIQKENHS
jgi:hypothetical protein